ncbi:MAG: 50S ribosomal protein L29 [Bacillota bacterium]
MKVNDLRKLSTQDLSAREKEFKTELFNLRFQLATGQLQNPQRIKECKRDIARIKTLLCERELKAMGE